jgi:hypothetical protein
MIESGFRRKVAKNLREGGFFVQTIETSTGPGVPDLWWGNVGKSGWLELKYVLNMPIKPETSLFASLNHKLSNEQINWISLCKKAGCSAAILIGYEAEYFLVPGVHVEKFNKINTTELVKYKLTMNKLMEILSRGLT